HYPARGCWRSAARALPGLRSGSERTFGGRSQSKRRRLPQPVPLPGGLPKRQKSQAHRSWGARRRAHQLEPLREAMGNRTLALAVLFPGALVARPAVAETEKLSPAAQKMQWAQRAIERNPNSFQRYNDLAMALARRARETSEVSYYEQADAALQKSFQLMPGNVEGQKVRVWVLLGKHEFAQALKLASALNQEVPDDVSIYGFLVDANVELGNYGE